MIEVEPLVQKPADFAVAENDSEDMSANGQSQTVDRDQAGGEGSPNLAHTAPGRSLSSAKEFRGIFAEHPAGVCVVMWRAGQAIGGLTVSSVASVSADPPLFAFSLDARSQRLDQLRQAQTISVSFLAWGQPDVARLFATRGVDPLPAAHVVYITGRTPVIAGSRGWIRGETLSETAVGSSVLFVGRALECCTLPARAPLIYLRRQFVTVDGATTPGSASTQLEPADHFHGRVS